MVRPPLSTTPYALAGRGGGRGRGGGGGGGGSPYANPRWTRGSLKYQRPTEIDRINTALSARARYREATSYLLFFLQVLPGESTARKASFGMLMGPAWTARRFLPSFCFSSSFFLRVMSPP